MAHYIVENMDFVLLAKHEDKDEAIRLAREKQPEGRLLWTRINDQLQEEHGGIVGNVPF